MADRAEVIRSFLVSLGWQIDDHGLRKFTEALGITNKRALIVTGTIAGVAFAVEEMVRHFAASMTKLYYASQRTNTPVSQLQAFRFAAEQVGIAGDDALSSLEALHAEIRKNPGKNALLRSLGISMDGTTGLEKIVSLVDNLNKKFPYFVAQLYGQQFGIPEQTFFQLTNNKEQFLKSLTEARELMHSLGMDTQAAATAAVQYQRELNELGLRFDLLKQKALTAAMPAFRSITDFLLHPSLPSAPGAGAGGEKPALSQTPGSAVTGSVRGRYGRTGSAQGRSQAERDLARTWGGLSAWWREHSATNSRSYEEALRDLSGGTAVAANQADLRAMANKVAEEFGIPSALFSSMISMESGWKPGAVSKKGAMGLTQLMPGTAQDMGVTDRLDPLQNLRGGARYLKQQFDRFGNWRDAFAAYNFGPNRDFSPAYATYADPILRAASAQGGVTISQQTTIHVNGGGNATAVASAVAGEQRGVNSDLVRIFANGPR